MVDILQVVNIAMMVAGGVCVVAAVAWLARARRWRDPLADVAVPDRGPGMVAALLVFLLLFLVQASVVSLMAGTDVRDGTGSPGSDGWHRTRLLDDSGKVLLWLVMVGLLRQTGSFAYAQQRVGIGVGVLLAIGAFLVILPVTTVQLLAGNALWSWVQPDAPPPEHPVLDALAVRGWGDWGVLQLFLGAVVVAPVTEELLFRGVLLQALARYGGLAWPAVLGSALVFGLLHVAQPQAVVPLATMGVILGFLRLRSGLLWPCVLCHALFNARTMVYTVLAPELAGAGG
jgi:membrane protease YdiL (CAAX protease family)